MVAPVRVATPAACLHCGLAPPAGRTDGFCCEGCRAVYTLLHDGGLARYYALRGPKGVPVATRGGADAKWIEALDATLVPDDDGVRRTQLGIQGLHCAACVWLIEKLFARLPGGMRLEINPALGVIDLAWRAPFTLAA